MAIKYTLVHLGFHFEILATKKFHVVVEFFRAIGAVASAGALHAQGRGFKSLIAHHVCSCGSFFYPLFVCMWARTLRSVCRHFSRAYLRSILVCAPHGKNQYKLCISYILLLICTGIINNRACTHSKRRFVHDSAS